MFDKLFSFLGFNQGQSLVGLSHLSEKTTTQKATNPQAEKNKEVKLSDLMRGI